MEIRDLLEQGLSTSEIARRLGCDRKTVRRAIRRNCAPLSRRRRGGVKRDVKLDPFKDYLRARMDQGVFNSVVLIDEIRGRGYTGGITVLRRYVGPYRPRLFAQPVVRFETEPGRQGQADFVDIPLLLPDRNRRLLRLFNYTLGYSRFAAMLFMPDEGRISWFRGLDHAFRATGGVPHELLTDRASPLVIGKDENGEPIFAPEYLAFAEHYGFVPKVARKAQTKGKCERQGGYVQDNFLQRIRGTITAPVDPDTLNRPLQHWLGSIANVRVHGTTHVRPIDRLAEDQAALRPLPQAPFGLDQIASRRVSRDGYVLWKTCRYAVPWQLFDRDVYVHETPDRQIRIEFDGRYVASYARAGERHAKIDNDAFRVGQFEAATRNPRMLVATVTPEVDAWPLEMYERFAAAAER
jgi:transposase